MKKTNRKIQEVNVSPSITWTVKTVKHITDVREERDEVALKAYKAELTQRREKVLAMDSFHPVSSAPLRDQGRTKTGPSGRAGAHGREGHDAIYRQPALRGV